MLNLYTYKTIKIACTALLLAGASIAQAETIQFDKDRVAKSAVAEVPLAASPLTSTAPALVQPISFEMKNAEHSGSSAAATSDGKAPTATAVASAAAEEASRFQTPAATRLARKREQARAQRMEMMYLGPSAIDAAQTIYAVSSGKGQEMNPLLGRHPSAMKVIGLKLVASTAHYLGFRRLNKTNPKAAYRIAMISSLVQGAVVGLNMRVVLK